MIVGIGTDIVAIDRVRNFLRRQPRLPERLLGPSERSQYEALPASKRARFLAFAIAAKEAAVKALATGIGSGVGWHDFATARNGGGMPVLAAKGLASELAQGRGIDCWHLSLSDDQGCALAFVVAESRSPAKD